MSCLVSKVSHEACTSSRCNSSCCVSPMTNNDTMSVKLESLFVHHNFSSYNVVCTTEWNQVKSKDRKRPIDSGVLLMLRNKKNKNTILIGEQSGVKK